MDKTNAFHTERAASRGLRWLAAWRSMAQLGMLLDGRAHDWAAGAVVGEPRRSKLVAHERGKSALRLARFPA